MSTVVDTPISVDLVLSVIRRTKAENNDDQLDCSNCEFKCPAWCLDLQKKVLNARWIQYFR